MDQKKEIKLSVQSQLAKDESEEKKKPNTML